MNQDPLAKKAIAQEIMTLQALKHQNIVQILDYGNDGVLLSPTMTVAS